MSGHEEFFSTKQKRLLDIATWSGILSWIVLITYLLVVGVQITQLILTKDNGNIFGATSQNLATMLQRDPLNLFKLVINMAATFLKGFVYYLVLKGVSLGLNMIVETDINFREQMGAK